jgi:hypothetical protein
MSDLDAHIGYFESTDVCWEQCSNLFGDVLYAVDFWRSEEAELGDCYCQHDCFCMTDIEDDEVINMTLDSLTVLPEPCEEEWEQDMDDEYDECWETHEDREGETSEEKCYALEGCFFDADYDECYSADWEEWDHEFNWDDWRSNFDMSGDYWFYDADMSGLFPYPMFEDNVDWMCDEEEVCFFFNANDYQVCIRGDECYSPEDALDLYFAHKNGEYDDHEEYDECWETHDEREGETSEEKCYALEGCIYDSEYDHCYSEWQEWDDHEFNWDDWRSNFELYEGWFLDADLSVVFPVWYEEDGLEWNCDYNDVCWYFDHDNYQVCIRDMDCYSPEDALDLYFDHSGLDDEYSWEDDFDFSNPEWYLEITEDFDFLHIFHMEETDSEGQVFNCDDEYICWRQDEETGLYCEMDGECYDFDAAIYRYFGEDNWSDWDTEFNWDDWRSNFDLTYDGWFYDADLSVVFPEQYEQDGQWWMCDYDDVCSYFIESDYQVCIPDMDCYAPEDALDIYF